MFKFFFKLMNPVLHASYDFISNFLLAKKMRVLSCDVNTVAISRGES